uniref:Uncharacterized protein n=1 Tax=Romanomermis culicivorax TaxID=13658 RepID=A0A915KMP4_ROMCU
MCEEGFLKYVYIFPPKRISLGFIIFTDKNRYLQLGQEEHQIICLQCKKYENLPQYAKRRA